MKTKPIPVIVMLLAGGISCIYGIINHLDLIQFMWTLLIVMIIFYVLGSVVKVILDKNFKSMEEEEEEITEQTETETEPVEEDITEEQ